MIKFLQNLTERMNAISEARRMQTAAKIQEIRDTRKMRKEFRNQHNNAQATPGAYGGNTVAPASGTWAGKAEEMKTERSARRESMQKRREELMVKRNQPKSVIAKRVNWFVAPVSAILGILIMQTDTWPTLPLEAFITRFGFKSNFLVFLPIGIAMMIVVAIVAAFLTRILESRFGKDTTGGNGL